MQLKFKDFPGQKNNPVIHNIIECAFLANMKYVRIHFNTNELRYGFYIRMKYHFISRANSILYKIKFPFALVVMIFISSVAWAQGFAREDQLKTLRSNLGDVGTRVQESILQTTQAMNALEDLERSERTVVAFALLDSIEAETRVVLEQVKLNSPFMDALDNARSNVVTILRKNEREPQSPERDARIARLTASLEDLENQYRQIQAAESQMTRLLSDHALMRREIQLDGEVQAVEHFVTKLSNLTDDLSEMASLLASIAQSPVDTGDVAIINQE